jgi:preprotein translocase subunit SecG
MMKKLKRLMVMLLAFTLLCSLLPANVYASGREKTHGGTPQGGTSQGGTSQGGTSQGETPQGETTCGVTEGNQFSPSNLEISSTNHYRLDGSRSSNVVLYVTTGDGADGLTEIQPGQDFVTTSPDTYFFVRVQDGYKAETSFEHTYAYGSTSRTDYPEWSTSQTQVSIYHDLQDATYNPPLQSEAKKLGCTYKFQYTGKKSDDGNFWAQFAIKGVPFPVQLVYSIDGDTTVITDSSTYYHENVTEKSNHTFTTPTVEETKKKTGKTLVKWLGSDGKEYAPGSTVSISTIWNTVYQSGGTFTLKAVWEEEIPKVSIAYDGNGNTSIGNLVDSRSPYDVGSEVTVLSNTWDKAGYRFTEWNTKKDGSGDSYDAGDIITLNSAIVLYAQWEKVEKTVICLDAARDSVKYDGTTHQLSGYTVTSVNGETVENKDGNKFVYNNETYTISGISARSKEAVDAGNYEVTFSGTPSVSKNGKNVTSQFVFENRSGSLTILPRTVVMTSQTVSEKYSGNPLINLNVMESGDGFIDGEGAKYTFSQSAKAVKPNQTVVNSFKYELKANTKESNYQISTVFGTLTLTCEKPMYTIQVEANSKTCIYDGKEHSVGGFKTSNTYTFDGKIYTVTGLTAETVSAKDYQSGGYAVDVEGTAVVLDEDQNDVSELFEVKIKNGTLMIEKRPILLRSASAQKEYDGTMLTAETVTDSLNVSSSDSETEEGQKTQEGFVGDDGAEYDFTGSGILTGTAQNVFSYKLKEGTKEDNYIISTEYGTLNVQNVVQEELPHYTIKLQPVSGEVIYNGREQSLSGFETTTFTIDGEDYEVSGIQAVAKGTTPGVYSSTYSGTAVVKDSKNNDVTSQFTIDTSAVGTLTIKGIYALTINYVDAAGRILAPSYQEYFAEGTMFEPVITPEVTGYKPEFSAVSCPAGGMPNRDIMVDVVYRWISTDSNSGDGNPSDQTPDNGTGDTENTENTETPENPTGQPDNNGTDGTTDNGTPENPTGQPDNNGTGGTTDNGTPENPTGQPDNNGTGGTTDNGTPGNTVGQQGNNGTGNTPAGGQETVERTIPVPVVTERENADNTTTIEDEEPPKGVLTIDEDGNPQIVEIDDEQTALAAGDDGQDASWALINLLATVFSVLICLVLLVTFFRKKKEKDDEEAKREQEDEDEDDEEKRSRNALRLGSIIPAAASVIIFFVTENVKNPMIYVDKWTILMIVLFAAELLLAYLVAKKKKNSDEDSAKKENS